MLFTLILHHSSIMRFQSSSNNKRRQKSILAFLAAAGVVGSLLLFISENVDSSFEYRAYNRQLDATPTEKVKGKTRIADPKKSTEVRDAALLNDTDVASSATAVGPNVIYIQHETLSGSLMLNTEDGVKATPFFQDLMHNDPNMFVFEHTRTGSGNTIEALPSLMTGCLPYNGDGVKYSHAIGQSIGYDFHNLGYRTASFSSRALDKTIVGGRWKMLHDLLVGGMDKVYDLASQKWPRDNAQGSDDRRMLPLFEEWVNKLEDKTANEPFYAQFYNFNLHYPYVKDSKLPPRAHRYYDSLSTMDEFLKRLFEILEKTGQLENTIIVGSGDHGDVPMWQGGMYARLTASNSHVYHTASYIYYPQSLSSDQSVANLLRSNTQKLTYTLDFYPTLQSILRRTTSYDKDIGTPEGCITGVDLTSVDIPEDRVVLQQNLVSSKMASASPSRFWAISTKDLSLYHRLHKRMSGPLRQGKNSVYVLEYGDCTKYTDKRHLCQEKASQEHLKYFRDAIQWIKDTNLLGEGVKESQIVNFFGLMTGWKDEPVQVE